MSQIVVRKNYILISILFIAIHLPGVAQNKWSINLIPDSLKENANIVLRQNSVSYQRKDLSSYTKTTHYVATILNSNGKYAASLRVLYDQNSEVTDIEAYLYDKNGKLIRKIKKKEIKDYASNNDFTLFSDNRMKYYSPACNFYPFTIEYVYTVNNSSLVGFANWNPTEWYDTSVQKASLTFSTPENLKLNHRELNGYISFSKKTNDQRTVYSWNASNIKAYRNSFSLPPYYNVLPTVMIAPVQIAYENHEGRFDSWKDLGKWTYSLCNGRQQLSAETVQHLKQLTDTIASAKEKVRALYRYMQGRTRYVNISLGIGGFQPLAAQEVDDKGYGDCKALSNYMHAILQSVGINSYYTEIGNGKQQQIAFPDFPSESQTNHVILCVPLETDTCWLECTNQRFPFNYIGASNSNRYGLLVTPEGGKLTRTPTYDAKDNYRNSKIAVILDSQGQAKINAQSVFSDAEYEDILGLIYESPEEQKKALLSIISKNGLHLNNFSFRDSSGLGAKASLELEAKKENYALKTGSRMFVTPSFLFGNDFPYKIPESRKVALYQSFGYEYKDTLIISIPADYSLEMLPKSTSSSSCYGNYKITYVKNNDKLRIARFVHINSGTFKPEEFNQINAFLKVCYSYNRSKIVLRQKT